MSAISGVLFALAAAEQAKKTANAKRKPGRPRKVVVPKTLLGGWQPKRGPGRPLKKYRFSDESIASLAAHVSELVHRAKVAGRHLSAREALREDIVAWNLSAGRSRHEAYRLAKRRVPALIKLLSRRQTRV